MGSKNKKFEANLWCDQECSKLGLGETEWPAETLLSCWVLYLDPSEKAEWRAGWGIPRQGKGPEAGCIWWEERKAMWLVPCEWGWRMESWCQRGKELRRPELAWGAWEDRRAVGLSGTASHGPFSKRAMWSMLCFEKKLVTAMRGLDEGK